MRWWWSFSATPECRDGGTHGDSVCRAWAWDHCTGGRCKAHCDARCKCVPIGQAGALRVFDGGVTHGKGGKR